MLTKSLKFAQKHKFLISNGIFFSLLLMIIVPVFVNGAQITPTCGQYNDCGYDDLLKLVNNFINWIIMISAPVAAGVFAWAGITYMTTGVSDKKSYAKSMMTKVFIGFVIILAAWLIVTTITNVLLANPSSIPVR